jgi:hypothetical protein
VRGTPKENMFGEEDRGSEGNERSCSPMVALVRLSLSIDELAGILTHISLAF